MVHWSVGEIGLCLHITYAGIFGDEENKLLACGDRDGKEFQSMADLHCGKYGPFTICDHLQKLLCLGDNAFCCVNSSC